MKASFIISVLALALGVTALPAAEPNAEPDHKSPKTPCEPTKTTATKTTATVTTVTATPSPTCSQGQILACCNSVGALGADCLIDLLGGNCGSGNVQQCCQANQNGLINVNVQCVAVPIVL